MSIKQFNHLGLITSIPGLRLAIATAISCTRDGTWSKLAFEDDKIRVEVIIKPGSTYDGVFNDIIKRLTAMKKHILFARILEPPSNN